MGKDSLPPAECAVRVLSSHLVVEGDPAEDKACSKAKETLKMCLNDVG